MEILKNRKVLMSSASVLMALLGAWWAWSYFRTDPQVAKVRDMQAQMMTEEVRNLPPEKQFEKMREVMEEVRQLTPEQRREVMRDGGRGFQQMFQKELDGYFEAPKEQRVANLDKQIDRMESFRKTAEPFMQRMRAGGEGKGAKAGPRTPPSAEQRDKMMRGMLDRTTPEQRAKMSEFMAAMAKRREERGLPALPMPGRF